MFASDGGNVRKCLKVLDLEDMGLTTRESNGVKIVAI